MNRTLLRSALAKFIGTGIIATSLFQGTAQATPVIDRNNSTNFNVGYCTGNCDWQQEITAGLTGKLTGVTLFGSGTSEVRIANGAGFVSSGWAADILGANVNGTMIDLSAYDIFVTAGQKFVVDVFHGTGGLTGNTNMPSTGTLYLNWPQVGLNQLNYGQSAYQLGYVTYVDTAATRSNNVPEPSVLALLGLGLLGLGAARKRRG